MNDPAPADPFQRLRPRLFGVAYRMLGTRADTEDVLQDAWLRWQGADRKAIQSDEAWLVTVVTRLAIDRLRAAKTEREHYVGDWLPEPVFENANEVSLAFLHLLERLGPEERAAFLLRRAFDYDYGEISRMLGKREAAVRQLVHRAGERLRQERPRFDVPREAHQRLLDRFVQAATSGDRVAIRALLDDDAEAIGDGGGKASAVAGGLHGGERITNLYWAQHLRFGARLHYRVVTINGEPGLLRYLDGQLEMAQAIVTDGERIVGIYSVRNPDKLAHIAPPA